MTRARRRVIGVAQALALFPGISRSGITISAGLFLGLEREAAARFSFLMAMPVIAGAGLWKARTLVGRRPRRGAQVGELAVGVLTSAIFGFIADRLPAPLPARPRHWTSSSSIGSGCAAVVFAVPAVALTRGPRRWRS